MRIFWIIEDSDEESEIVKYKTRISWFIDDDSGNDDFFDKYWSKFKMKIFMNTELWGLDLKFLIFKDS